MGESTVAVFQTDPELIHGRCEKRRYTKTLPKEQILLATIFDAYLLMLSVTFVFLSFCQDNGNSYGLV